MLAQTNKVSFLTITALAGAGQRIDNFLVKKLNNVPKSKIYSILRKGEVRVNKARIKPSYKLQTDDIVRLPPLTTSQSAPPKIPQTAIARINIDAAILYEDQNLLIINKPAGLAVHGGSGINFGVIEMLRAVRPHDTALELVHRIDRDTSGCVMVAKNLPMLRAMHELFRNKRINKIYHALVKGFAPDEFVVKDALKKYVLHSGERLVGNDENGMASITKFVALQRFNGVTLLQAEPVTGRTHQIRVHASLRGLPIIGDQKYGDKIYNQIMQKLGLKRLFLHARALNFVCPLSGKAINITADYDNGWEEGLKSLQ